jgi:hypothetical protein
MLGVVSWVAALGVHGSGGFAVTLWWKREDDGQPAHPLPAGRCPEALAPVFEAQETKWPRYGPALHRISPVARVSTGEAAWNRLPGGPLQITHWQVLQRRGVLR